MAEEPDLLDNEQINNLRELFSDGFKDFIQTYFTDFEQKENELTAALKDKRIDSIVKIAHSLKGSSLNMGASALAKVCYDLEMAGKRENIEEIMNSYDELQKIYPKTKQAFQQIS